jgi:hypothetical protein
VPIDASGPLSPYEDIYRGGFCSEDWCWSNPLPQGNGIRTFWSAPGGEAWAGADGSTVLRWNVDHWERLAISTHGFYPAIWGSGPGDVYITAYKDLWHFDGTKLEKVALPPGFDSSYFNDISGTAKNDVWAARDDGVAHFDGVSWSMVSAIPKLEGYSYVAAAGPNDIWFGGSQSIFGIYLWNKVQWQTVVPDYSSRLWAAAPDEIWYNSSRDGVQKGNAAGFAHVAVAGTQWANENIFGTGPKDVYVINDSPDVSHFDGTTWTTGIGRTSTTLHGGEARTGTSATPGDAWLGGSRGRLWRLQGTTLTLAVPTSDVPALNEITSVWSDGTKVYAVGLGVLELDASGATDRWTRVAGTETINTLTGIWGASAAEMWIVGSYDRMYRFDGTSMTLVKHGDAAVGASDLDWVAVSGTSAKNVWAVGTWGYAAHYDGVSWTETRSGIMTPKNLWVDANGEVWVCGEGGLVTHYVPGSGWTSFPELENPNVKWNSITGTSGSDVWVASGESQLRHYDGQKWSLLFSIPDRYNDITQLRALAPDDIWGVGSFGTAVHWDGKTWREVETRFWDQLSGLWMDKSGEGWAVGRYGTILHHRAAVP